MWIGVLIYYSVYLLILHGSRKMTTPMTQSYKTPPHWEESKSFEKWKSEVELWTLVTDLDKKKQGPAIALSLGGCKRDTALQVPNAEMNTEDGLAKVLNKLKEAYGKEESDRLFEIYVKFESIQRNNRPMQDYIQEFESNYEELKKNNIQLPPEILACKLLYCAQLESRDRQIVLAAVAKLDFNSMKSSLRRIFSTCTSKDQGEGILKVEPAFVGATDTAQINLCVYP